MRRIVLVFVLLLSACGKPPQPGVVGDVFINDQCYASGGEYWLLRMPNACNMMGQACVKVTGQDVYFNGSKLSETTCAYGMILQMSQAKESQ